VKFAYVLIAEKEVIEMGLGFVRYYVNKFVRYVVIMIQKTPHGK
jgi:hypothetical protein